MGSQIIKQPNDLYAVFSSICDGFTLIDATREEVADYFAEKAEMDSRRDTQHSFDSLDKGIGSQFSLTFAEAAEMHLENFHDGEDGGKINGDIRVML